MLKMLIVLALLGFEISIFACVDEFPTPPWTKSVEGEGEAKGAKAQACADAEALANKDLAEQIDTLKMLCEKNKGVPEVPGGGFGTCAYYKLSQEAFYTSSKEVRCKAKD